MIETSMGNPALSRAEPEAAGMSSTRLGPIVPR
ncbi:MAG: hypothetical protein QOG25_3486 [Acetobacteraceae bacterium]|nr:hypothetical protein [Acetobacteraceae bacterium]